MDTYSLVFFSCNLILSQYVHNDRPLPHPHLLSILINYFKVTTYLSCGKDHYRSYQMCINTLQKQEFMNTNNQDTFIQLYYARNVILGK